MNRTEAALAALQNHVGTNATVVNEYLNVAAKQCELTKDLMVSAAEEVLGKAVQRAQHVIPISGRDGGPTKLIDKLRSLRAQNLPISSVTFDPNSLTLYVTIAKQPD